VAIVVATGVIAIAIAIARAIEWRRRTAVALVLGVALGLGLVWACELLPRNPKAARNLAYVERVWEPTAETPSSIVLAPIDAARSDRARER
jgi:hypothetical protein